MPKTHAWVNSDTPELNRRDPALPALLRKRRPRHRPLSYVKSSVLAIEAVRRSWIAETRHRSVVKVTFSEIRASPCWKSYV